MCRVNTQPSGYIMLKQRRFNVPAGNIPLFYRRSKRHPLNYPHDAMINPPWLKLQMSRTNFYGPKDVRAIEVRLYAEIDRMVV